MAVSETAFVQLQARVTNLEQAVNQLFTSIAAFTTNTQVQQLLTITQTNIQALQESLDSLDERVTSIEEEPLT